ncbi:hypothetical protein LguiB_033527 [Lonicera macranthoides]
MELNHFSHVDHPLMLVNHVQKEEGEEDVVCHGCQKPISSSAYGCNHCNYFLHKKCAELPKEITHDKHPQHPLTLLSHPPDLSSRYDCDVCGIEDWKWFIYHCSKCEFDVHISCVLEDRVVEHEGHPHPLTVVHKKALFNCDACFTEDKDLSYFCNTCEFWIHKSCALSPSTIQHNSHIHPLVLNYSLPYIHRSFPFNCDICKERVHPNFWVYDCDPCRYFVHVKCATSKTMMRGANTETTAEDDEIEPSVIKFPIVDESVNLLDELLKEANLGDTNRATILTHFSHDHPLILFNNKDEMKNDEIIICKGCLIAIISTPFYGCDQCSFFLHGSCAEVPQELRHPCHQEDHQFNLKMSFTSQDKFPCYSCYRFHNGFRYKCDSCDFTICVVCALLPVKIRHETHDHPLRIQRVEKVTVCNGCRFSIRGGLIYRCHTCDYYVDIHCLKLPHKIKHAWDRHLLTLRYPPYSDHPDEFYCEICEEEIHPKYWLYHCHHCDQPFHIECLFPIFEYLTRDINAGDTIEVGIHPHKLSTVFHRAENRPSFKCKRCDRIIPNAEGLLKCEPCRWQLCLFCAWSNS